MIKRTIRYALTLFILSDYWRFKSLDLDPRFSNSLLNAYPQIKDKTIKTSFDRHYVYHTSWAARVLKETRPLKHVDISSSLYFSGIVSAFIPMEFYDFRPANIDLSNLKSEEGNLLSLPFADNSINSLSCMHTLEHIGLGRYGDVIDPDGDKKASLELMRVLSPGGSLLFVTPLAEKPTIEFNAHRIYSYDQIISTFSELSLKEFAFIPEHEAKGGLIRNADPTLLSGESYACGCFWFIKK